MLSGIWKEFLEIVRAEAGSQVVETWLKAVVLERWDAVRQTAYIKAPNSFVKDWVSGKYQSLFKLHLGRLLNVDRVELYFYVANATQAVDHAIDLVAESTPSLERPIKALVPGKLPNLMKAELRQLSKNSQVTINPSYTFDSFIVGPSNSLAHAAAMAVAEQPGTLYNPLFIYGASGLGKTHLLHAIGNLIAAQTPDKLVVYQTADRFVNEFISAIRFNRMFAFREKYRYVDVLLIDDIQFISNKDQTQEVFFHIFNTLHETNKQIVFTSDTYPNDLKGISERLRSRMAWGLVTDIYVPTIETKVAILKKKAEQNRETLDDEVAMFIAGQGNLNIRQLEGALIRVIAFAHLTGQPITSILAHKVLDVVVEASPNNLTLTKIAQVVASSYDCTLERLRSRDRDKELVFVRQLAMYLMKRLTDKSLKEIGQFLNRKDHSTVIHAVDKLEDLIQGDSELQARVASLRQELVG